MFSVAFGNSGCRGSVGGLATFVPQVQTLKCWRNKPIGEFGACSSGKFFKLIKLSEMQFSAFPGPEMVNREGLLKH